MNLSEILNIKTTDLNMSCHTKEEAIEHLALLLKDAGNITDTEEFVRDIYEREKLGITGIGNGIAIPHGKSDVVKVNGIAIGKCNQGLDWESLDNQKVNLVLLFCVGNNESYADEHLRMLAEVARKLGNDEAVKRLLNAKEFNEIVEIFEN